MMTTALVPGTISVPPITKASSARWVHDTRVSECRECYARRRHAFCSALNLLQTMSEESLFPTLPPAYLSPDSLRHASCDSTTDAHTHFQGTHSSNEARASYHGTGDVTAPLLTSVVPADARLSSVVSAPAGHLADLRTA